MIEIEKRALLKKSEYEKLLKYFASEGKFVKRFKRFTILQVTRSDFVPSVDAKMDMRVRIDGGEK